MVGKSTTSEILKIASLPETIRSDARIKPYMTRERLLKVARRKSVDVQEKVYANLRQKLEKSENTSINQLQNLKEPRKSGIALLMRRSVKFK